MRRGTLLALGLLLASTAVPATPAKAAPDLPRALFGAITRPLGAILGGVHRAGRRGHRPRRATVARDRKPPAEVQAPATAATGGGAAGAAVAVGAGAAAAGAAVASGSPAEAKPGPEATPAVAKPQEVATPAAAAAAPPAPSDTTPVAAKPAETKPAETKAAESKAAETKPAEAKPVEAKAVETKPAETKPPETRAAETKPVEAKPADAAPVAEAKPVPAPAPQPAARVATPQPAAAAAAQRNAALAQPAEPLQPRTAPRSVAAQAETPQLRLGVAGPANWPGAFEDVVGYALWPADYAERLRSHGIGDVLGSVFGGQRMRAAYARNDSGSRETVASGAPFNPCSAGGSGSGDWPAAQIEQSTRLDAAQRTALAQLKTAVADAAASIRATCRDEAQLPPSERLKAMQNALWAVHDAAQQIRTPLARFYDSLSDAQRKAFAAPPAAQADPRAMSQAAIARMCGMPASGDASIRQLENALGQSKAQRASLETFQRKSSEMGQFLMASCLKPVPSTPAERLDAAADRLTAVIFAASTVNLAFNDLYNQLSDEQKAKFNAAGR